ncbi:NACHT, LRR and PYD domains-containing protein 12-like isoform X2 [Archocentrus centrarchus]|uniref:NACHT, LRR and PYD domains-containing protein 12-like isoform X2 n=1 Tax=Archocentrus centrarchus TaxID=63155 RepID=UPI0011E9B6C0|nr:NACHT, LRR and PYD domains-containing protein 12-like isoform X2 [Archocentrus centrarchus]
MDLQTCLKTALRSKYESLNEAYSENSILPSRLCYRELNHNYAVDDLHQHEFRSPDNPFLDTPLKDVLSCARKHDSRGRVLITFWELNLLKYRLSLTELLQVFYPELKEFDASVLNEGDVWFILDGLDDFKIHLDFGCPAVSDVSEASTIDGLITNLIRGNLLPKARIWLTSPNSAATRVPACYFLNETELLGFSDEQKEQCFRRIIGDDDLAIKAINHVKISRSLDFLCRIPPVCTIMAGVLKDHLKGKKGFKIYPLSLTQIYSQYFDALDATKLAIVNKLKELALFLVGAVNVMYEGDLSASNIGLKEASDFAETFPLVLREEMGLYGTAVFRFGHLSVQEFLAASRKLDIIKASGSSLSSSIQHQVDKVENGEENSELLLRFTFGLIKERRLLSSNDLLFVYIKKKIIETISSSTSVILFDCLWEYDSRALLDEVKSFQKNGLSLIPGFTSVHWKEIIKRTRAFEGIQETFKMKVSVSCDEKLIRNLPAVLKSRKAMLKFSNLTDKSCPALAAVLSTRESYLRKLDLGYNSFSDGGVRELAEGLNSEDCRLKILRLQGCGLTSEACKYLIQSLIQNQRLEELDLSCNEIGDEGLKFLSMGLGTSHCQLETLKLSQCNITQSGCYHLASALRRNPAYLSVLDLSINVIGDEGANEIFSNFDISQLTKLELYHCGLTVLSCAHIGEALKSETSNLVELNLSNNSLKDAGFEFICEGMYAWSSLEKLNVSRCGITGTGCKYLASVLCSVSQLYNNWMQNSWEAVELQELDVSMNRLGDRGVKGISAGLKNPLSHLRSLNLSYCSLTDDCCAELASGLASKVNVLGKLDLSHNNLRDKGVKKLCMGLKTPQCRLEKLLLRSCGLTSRSVQFLTSALKSNPLHLSELHLMGNKLEDSEIRVLAELTRNQKYSLSTIDVSVD